YCAFPATSAETGLPLCFVGSFECSSVRAFASGICCWQYCEASVRFIFNQNLSCTVAVTIYNALKAHSEGMTKTQIHAVLLEISTSPFGKMEASGRIRVERSAEGVGRPSERWFALQAEA